MLGNIWYGKLLLLWFFTWETFVFVFVFVPLFHFVIKNKLPLSQVRHDPTQKWIIANCVETWNNCQVFFISKSNPKLEKLCRGTEVWFNLTKSFISQMSKNENQLIPHVKKLVCIGTTGSYLSGIWTRGRCYKHFWTPSLGV